MPVYNEEVSINKVVDEWILVLKDNVKNFVMLCIDDGSSDGTLYKLNTLRKKYGDYMDILSRENKGHGPSCIQGYNIACEQNIPFVFQIDSDGQCDPKYFSELWAKRFDYDVVYGNRVKRLDGWSRVIISKILRLFILVLFKANCVDANVPYRLMRADILKKVLSNMPEKVYLANIAVSVLFRRLQASQGVVPIVFRDRFGGEPSVKFSKFGIKAWELYKQMSALKI